MLVRTSVPKKPNEVLNELPKSIKSFYRSDDTSSEFNYLVSTSDSPEEVEANFNIFAEDLDAGIPVDLPRGYGWVVGERLTRIAPVHPQDHPIGIVNDKIIALLKAYGVKVFVSQEDGKQVLQYVPAGIFSRPLNSDGMKKAFLQLIRDHFKGMIARGNYTNIATNASVIISGLSETFEGMQFDPKSGETADFTYIDDSVRGVALPYYNAFDPLRAPALGGMVLDKASKPEDKLLGSVLFKAFDAVVLKMAGDSEVDGNGDAVLSQLRQVFGQLLSDKHNRLLVMMIIVSPDKGVGKSLFMTLLGNAMGYAFEADMIKMASGDFDVEWNEARLLMFDELKIDVQYLDRIKKIVTRISGNHNAKYGLSGKAYAHYSCIGTTNSIEDVALGEEERRFDGVNFDKLDGGVYPGNRTPQFEITAEELEALKPFLTCSIKALVTMQNGNIMMTLDRIGDLIESIDNAMPRLHQFTKLVTAAGWFDSQRGDLEDYNTVDGRIPTRASIEIQAIENASKYSDGKRIAVQMGKDYEGQDYITVVPYLTKFNITMSSDTQEYLEEHLKIQGIKFSLDFAEMVVRKDGYTGDIEVDEVVSTLPLEFQPIHVQAAAMPKAKARSFVYTKVIEQLCAEVPCSLEYASFVDTLESLTDHRGFDKMTMSIKGASNLLRARNQSDESNFTFSGFGKTSCNAAKR